ncbi:MAG: LuxR C-terminal-related transcriptional regulator [Acidimicrobiales bacterium]
MGRVEELAFLRRLRSGKSASAVLSGPAGVGKSRLAAAAAAEAAAEGWATLSLRASASLSGVPLGPLRTVLQTEPSADLAALSSSVHQALLGMSSGRGLLVCVDDGHDLDEASAALLQQAVAGGTIAVLVTIRSGVHPPAALTDLWKDGLAQRVDLQALSRREINELLAAALGGTVEASTADRIWQVTAGNALYVREVVLSSTESGALRQVDGEWRWRGEWATGARLQEIVAARLGRLDADELTAVEMLAVAGSLPLGLLSGLTTNEALERLEARGLVAIEVSGRRLEVVISHPLHAEVMRGRMPALQQRSVRRNLVDALGRTGARRASDRVRLACWSADSGLEVDPLTLALGAQASLIGQAISARLDEILPGVPVGVRGQSDTAVPRDLELAVRLARAAYEQANAIPEGAALASALAWTGDISGAEAVLAELSARATAPDDRLRLAIGLAWTLFWGRSRVEEAKAALMRAAAQASADCTPALLAEVYRGLADIEMHTGHPAEALASAEKIASMLDVDVSECAAAPFAAAGLAYLGRYSEAMSLVELSLPLALEREGRETEVGHLLFVRASVLSSMGRHEQAQELAESCRQVALDAGESDAAAVFGILAGDILLRQGRPASAARLLRDAAGLLAERDRLGYRPWALTGLACARAQSGDEEGAAAALDEARRIQPIPRHFEHSRYLAEVALHSLAGRPPAALEAGLAGVAWSREAGMVAYEALLLDACLRVEPSGEFAERLSELAALTDSELVAALAHHAAALVADDAEALLVSSEELARMSAFSMAAAAAAAAARIHTRRHQARAAQAASRLATGFASYCEGSRSAAVVTNVATVGLTRREMEVAQLAAAGRSSKEIAKRLVLSVRTVESHLHHAYVKLGVSDRAGLAAAVIDTAPQ